MSMVHEAITTESWVLTWQLALQAAQCLAEGSWRVQAAGPRSIAADWPGSGPRHNPASRPGHDGQREGWATRTVADKTPTSSASPVAEPSKLVDRLQAGR